jgi:anti-anti-sigma factor
MNQLDSITYFVVGVRELVKGQEQKFVDELQPLVRIQSVRLDLSSVERIDAAGLAAIVSLYCDACKTGHEFSVVNPSRHVARILEIVGLDRVLSAMESSGKLETLAPGIPANQEAA